MTFLERYQKGEYVKVWDELTALGPGVRHKLYLEDATAVAAETMRRARHNVELLIQRLADAGYRFTPPSEESMMAARNAARAAKLAETLKASPLEDRGVFDPPGKQTAAQLQKLEKAAGGPLAISLHAWYEQVGGVALMGSHDIFNPEGDHIPDPLVVAPLKELIEMQEAFGDELWLAPDDFHKANFSGGEPYTIRIPNPAADAKLEREWHNTTFVKYLRKVFEWGGFPGWERSRKPPREAIAELTEDLLPL